MNSKKILTKTILLIMVFYIFSFRLVFAESSLIEVPTTDIYFQDNASMFKDESTKTYILNNTEQLKKQFGAEITVVTISELPSNYTIENYSKDLFNLWGIGDKDKNNGVLILISKDDRKFRVCTGVGIENYLTESKLSNYLNDLSNSFKNEKYDEGILNLYNKIKTDINNLYSQNNNENNNKSKTEDINNRNVNINKTFIILNFISIPLLIVSFGVQNDYLKENKELTERLEKMSIENKKNIKEIKESKDINDKNDKTIKIIIDEKNNLTFENNHLLEVLRLNNHQIYKQEIERKSKEEERRRMEIEENLKNEKLRKEAEQVIKNKKNESSYSKPKSTDYNSSFGGCNSSFGGGFSDGGGCSGDW